MEAKAEEVQLKGQVNPFYAERDFNCHFYAILSYFPGKVSMFYI